MSEIPPVHTPMPTLPQDKKLKEDGKRKQDRSHPQPPVKKPPPDDPQHIDEYA